MSSPTYHELVRHYEKRLSEHGANYRGMDWPNEEDLEKRFKVMLGVIGAPTSERVSILDLGCGVGLLLDYAQSPGVADSLEYWGIDISGKMIQEALRRHSNQRFETRDVLRNPLSPQCVDYVVMNGLLTEKATLSHESMECFARDVIKAAFSACRLGIAFNVMSTHVDWLRDDLFHWPLDSAVGFLVANCSRSLVIRMDYGLYEYTVYAYREPTV